MPTQINNLTFEAWYKKVDIAVSNIAGIGVDDLADGPSWDRWNDETTPVEYAREVLEDNDFPFA